MEDPAIENRRSYEAIALSQYEIVRRIFSSLPMKDVYCLSSVCKIWLEVSSRTRKDRSRLKPVIFCWRAPLRPLGFYKDHEFPKSPDHDDFRQKFSQFISEVWIDPEVSLILSVGEPSDFLSEDAILDENEKIIALPGFHLDPLEMDKLLPKNCISMSLSMSGVVLSLENDEVVEIENMMTPPEVDVGVAILLLPRCPRTKIIPFLVSESKSVLQSDIEDIKESRPEFSSQQVFEELLDRTCGYRLTPEDKIRSLIAFTNNHEYPYVTRLVKTVGTRTNREVAVGGAVGHLARCSSGKESLYNSLEEFREFENGNMEIGDDYLKTVGLIIAGDGVEAASIVIGRTIKSEEKLKQELSKLKSCGLSEERSVGLMFACCARGKYFHKKPNVESKVFRSLFPKTPLIGAFCGGEIGVSHLPNLPPSIEDQLIMAENPKKQKLDKDQAATFRDKDIAHSFTTVFLLLSY